MSAKNYYIAFGTPPSTYSGLSPTFISFVAPGGATTAPSISEISTTGIYTFSYECLGSIAFVVDGATTGLETASRYVVGSLDISDRIDQFVGSISDSVGASTVMGQVLDVKDRIGGASNVAGFSSLFGSIYQGNAYGATLLNRLGTSNDAAGFSTVFSSLFQNAAYGQTLIDRVGMATHVAGFSSLFGVVKANEAYGITAIALLGTDADAIGDSSTDPTTVFGFLKRCENVLEGQSVYTKASGSLAMKDKTGNTTLATRTISDSTTAVTKS